VKELRRYAAAYVYLMICRRIVERGGEQLRLARELLPKLEIRAADAWSQLPDADKRRVGYLAPEAVVAMYADVPAMTAWMAVFMPLQSIRPGDWCLHDRHWLGNCPACGRIVE